MDSHSIAHLYYCINAYFTREITCYFSFVPVTGNCRLGIAYAALGFKEKAIEEGKHGVKLAPETKNNVAHFNTTKDLATIYMMVGEYDIAIDEIEHLLIIPGELSIPLLKIDPLWAPLRNYPRFQELIESYK